MPDQKKDKTFVNMKTTVEWFSPESDEAKLFGGIEANGNVLDAETLLTVVDSVRRYTRRLNEGARRRVPVVVDAWYTLGGHHLDFSDADALTGIVPKLTEVLGALEPNLHITTTSLKTIAGEGEDASDTYRLVISTLRDGVERQTVLGPLAAEADGFSRLLETLTEKLPLPAQISGVLKPIHGWRQLLETVLANARKGYEVQRYKGLGEMNPDQLWETTMDPTRRTLLQVEVENPAGADQIFSVLMGDSVEPRRRFIQNNALNVRNLDV